MTQLSFYNNAAGVYLIYCQKRVIVFLAEGEEYEREFNSTDKVRD